MLSRCVVLRLIKVLRRDGIEFVSTQATQPKTLVHCFCESDEAIQPAIRKLEALHLRSSDRPNVPFDHAVPFVAETPALELSIGKYRYREIICANSSAVIDLGVSPT